MPIKSKKINKPNKKKILIVEDEKSMQRAMKLKFEIAGFDAVIADDGGIALSLMSEKKFDAVLLDLLMPNIDGFEVLEELKKRGDHTPVFIISVLNQEDDIKKAKDLGAVDFFVKSNTPVSKIVEKVNKIIGI